MRELVHQLLERLERVPRSLLVALGQVLAREAAEDAQVVVEVDQPLQIQRVVDRRAGGMQLDEALERGQCLGLFVLAVQHVGALDLGLLREDGAGGAPFEPLVQLAGAFPASGLGLLLGL